MAHVRAQHNKAGRVWSRGRVHIGLRHHRFGQWDVPCRGDFIYGYRVPTRGRDAEPVDCATCLRMIGAALDRFARSIGGARDFYLT
jgi:hypothetical protein